MSIYSYPESKVINEVTFDKSEGGHIRAYVHAAPDTNPQTLSDIICKLADSDWQVTPYSISGKPLLEVHGFHSEKQLIDLFEQSGWAEGKGQHVATTKEKLNISQKIKKRSLAASGLAYVVGDTSFATYGYKDGSPLNFAAGILYGAGTASLLGGGRKDQSDLQVCDISNRMAKHFRDLKIDLPPDCSLSAITEDHHKGLLQKADDFWRRYPSELMNTFFAAAGACIAIAAYKSMHHKISDKSFQQVFDRLKSKGFTEAIVKEKMTINHKRESWFDIGLGTMTGVSGLFAMLVKEKAHDPDDPPKHGLEAAWEFIREKPLAIAGAGYMVSTLCHAVSTTLAWKYADNERRKSVPFRALFVAANLVAEVLLAISSKGHGDGVKSDSHVDDTVVSLAADLIVKQPRKMQDFLINHMAGFLGRGDVLALGHKEATNKLRQQVEAMRSNPWALAGPVPVTSPQPDAPVWQAKLAAKEAQTLSPQLAT